MYVIRLRYILYIYIYFDAVARISLMNVIKVRMQSSYILCGIIMRRIHCTAIVWVWLRSGIDVFTCFLYVFFFVLTYFSFSHKTIPRGRPETRIYILPINDEWAIPSPRPAECICSGCSRKRRYTHCGGIVYSTYIILFTRKLFIKSFTKKKGDYF